MHPRTLTPLDYALLAAYFAGNLGIGWVMSRRRPSSDAFFRGNRRVPWWAAAVSWFAAGSSSISFMALPAKTYSTDWLSFGSAPAQAFAGMLAAFVFMGLMRRLDTTTVFAFLERRFSLTVRIMGAVAAALLKIVGRMSVVMLLPALALSTVTGLNAYVSVALMGAITIIYSMEGGFMAVIWTDVLQTIVTLGGILLALFFVCRSVPHGLIGVWSTARAMGKLRMVDWHWDFSQPTVWVFIGMFYSYVFIQISDQPYMQRAFATKDVRAAKMTMFFGNVLGFFSGILFFFVGTSLWVFYHFHPDRLSPDLANDKIVPYFIVNELPVGVVGLIIAGLFAASMGTLSSTMNATAAIILNDFYLPWRPRSTEAQRLKVAKRGTLFAGLFSTGVAAYLASVRTNSLWTIYLNIIALIGGGFAGVFALGLLTRRANAPGVIVGLVASGVFTGCVYTRVSEFFTGFIAVAVAMVVGYAASLICSPWARRVPLAGLTLWDLPPRPERAL